MPIRILIADDHGVVAEGLKQLVQAEADMEVVALVADGRTDAALLDTYHAERWPVAQRLLHTTDNAFRLVVGRQPLLRWLRLNLVPPVAARVMGRPAVRRWVFGTVSQIALAYRDGPLARGGVGDVDRLVARLCPGRGDRRERVAHFAVALHVPHPRHQLGGRGRFALRTCLVEQRALEAGLAHDRDRVLHRNAFPRVVAVMQVRVEDGQWLLRACRSDETADEPGERGAHT